MKVFKQINNRLEDNNDYLTDIIIKEWFQKKFNEVLKEGDQKRINKYKKIDIEKSFKLFNTGFFKGDGYIRSTIVSRKAGICFPDPKLDFLNFKKFLTTYFDPEKNFYLNEKYPEEFDPETIQELTSKLEKYPPSPEFYLSNLDDKFALSYICDNTEFLTPDYILDNFFKSYKFRKITVSIYQKTDENYPQDFDYDLEKIKVGVIKIEDKTLNEQSILINIYDIKLIDDFLNKSDVPLFYNGAIKYDGFNIYDGVF